MLRLVVFSSAMMLVLGLGVVQVEYKQPWFSKTGGGGLCRVDGAHQSFIGYTRLQCANLAFKTFGQTAAFDYRPLTRSCTLYSSNEGFLESVTGCDHHQMKAPDSTVEEIARTFTVEGLTTPYKLICSVQGVGVNFGCRTFFDNNPKTELVSSDVNSLASILHVSQTNLNDYRTGWVIIHQRLTQNLEHNRTWADYKQGFGSVTWWLSDFWIGLEAMHNLTTLTTGQPAGFSVRIEMLRTYDMKWYWAEYDTFWVDSESMRYTLHISGYRGTAGDSFGAGVPAILRGNGCPFSTRDRDNDQSTNNCALDVGSGWWFNNCMGVSLTSEVQNFAWGTLDMSSVPRRLLSASRMMIRRKM